jgi:dTDP-glucose pyrophosphorylase
MIKDWEKALISIGATVKEAAQTIDSNHMLVALVVDRERTLLGMVTDGDVRRAILNGVPLEAPVEKILSKNPQTILINETEQSIYNLFKKNNFRHMPIVDSNGKVVGLRMLDELHHTIKKQNIVVLMAGGVGERLGTLTQTCPKPLLKVGNKPLLETILENFIDYGFEKFYLSVNYKAEMIEDYFADGSNWGVDIQYIKENKRLGTAGALSLLPETNELPLVVMNGDVLTKVNFQSLLDFHKEQETNATMCVREYDFQVPYGVVQVEHNQIIKIEEKPVHRFFVNAGIYVLSPRILDLIPRQTFFDMPGLFEKMMERKMETTAFPIREYWLDIGQVGDFKQANGDYSGEFQ